VGSQDWLDDLKQTRKLVQKRLEKIHEDERSRYLKEHNSIHYQPGNTVWVRVRAKDKHKLEPQWMGPCEILKQVYGGRYTVQTAHGAQDDHMDSFKPYCPELTGKSIPFLYYRPSQVPEDDQWVVEKILKHRTQDDRTQWLVKWQGNDKPTWKVAEQFVGYTQEDWREYNLDHDIAVSFQ